MHNKKSNRIYYVVLNGRKPGIYRSRKQAIDQIYGFPHGRMRKIKGLKEAKFFFNENKQTKAKNKVYYVVKKGRNPGLYLDKDQALKQIKGFPYGKMKRIIGYDKAKAYFHGKNPGDKESIPNIFIDGSYIQKDAYSGYGLIVEENNQIIAKDSGAILDYDIINLHSLGSELYAFIRALEWAMANDYRSVRIIYDSTSIIQLLENNGIGDVKNSRGKTKLLNSYVSYKEHVQIELIHIKQHKVFEKRHKEAHDLSRMMSGMIRH